MLDHFQGGPGLVRGFEPAGWGPRDLTPGTNLDALGGSVYWAASYELQTPLFFAPKDFGMRFALFADVGQLWDYKGPTSFAQTGETICTGVVQGVDLAAGCNDTSLRASVGAGLLWDSPLGPLRFDFAYAVSKASFDRTQFFRFGGGTKF
jgi:outer membrane protein insertion porin family